MPARTRRLSAKEVLAELRRMQTVSKGPLTTALISSYSRSLYRDLLRHYGSVKAARKAARLSPPQPSRKRWTEGAVILELRRLYRKGVRLTAWNMRNSGYGPVLDAAKVYCGGLPRARRLAGLPDPRKERARPQPWDEERVIEEILELDRSGESLAPSKVPPTLLGAARRYFGSWEEAITAAGFDYGTICPRRARSVEELLDELRQLSRQQPGMTLSELSNLPISLRVRRRIGSLDGALERAGIQNWPSRLKWPAFGRSETLDRLRSRHREGLPLYERAVAQEDPRLARSVHRHFAFWEDALATAGLPNDSPLRRFRKTKR